MIRRRRPGIWLTRDAHLAIVTTTRRHGRCIGRGWIGRLRFWTDEGRDAAGFESPGDLVERIAPLDDLIPGSDFLREHGFDDVADLLHAVLRMRHVRCGRVPAEADLAGVWSMRSGDWALVTAFVGGCRPWRGAVLAEHRWTNVDSRISWLQGCSLVERIVALEHLSPAAAALESIGFSSSATLLRMIAEMEDPGP